MEKIGNRRAIRLYLREWREKRGLTLDQLADRMETTQGTVSKKERAPDTVNVAWMARFAAGLGLEVEQLFQHPDRPSSADLLREAAAAVPAERAAEVIDLLQVFAKRRSS